MLARSKQIKEEKAEAARASVALSISSEGSYMLRKKRGNEDIKEIIRVPTDIRNDARYEGQTAFMFKYVPLKCIDESTEVSEDTLREYIYHAIIEEDPIVKNFHKSFRRYAETLAEVDKKIKKISKMQFLDDDNKPLPEEKASEQRALMFELCGEERLKIETELKQKKELLELHIQSRKRTGVKLTKGDEDVNTGTCSWFVSLYGDDDASYLEELIIKKKDWPGIRLAGSGSTIKNEETVNVPPWAGRAVSVPTGKKVTEYDYRRLEVAIGAVRMMRVPSGVGLIKKLDRKSSSIYDDEFGMFYGEFESGRKEGYGIEINDAGIFAGRYCNGFREGQGRIDYADGTTMTGKFSLRLANEVKGYETSEFANPYRDGEPNGMVEIHFPDGGYYKGNMTDGIITGQGDYQSAFNEVLSGNFKDGLLHGPNGFWQNVAEDIYTGYYITGYRHGRGTLEYGAKRMTLNKYKAEFLKSKAASQSNPNPNPNHTSTSSANPTTSTTTTTTTTNDAKKTTSTTTETAENKDPNAPEISEAALSEFDILYQGFFVGNALANGGSAMDTEVRTPFTISRLNKRATVDIEKVFEKEIAYRKETQRLVEKLADMELFMREEICEKKKKIYNQQKHYTKKTMYADDKGQAISKNELNSKMLLRTERLGGLTEENHLFKKAAVPRLREINNSKAEHLTNAFGRIRPTDVKDMKKVDRIRDQKVKIAMSDFEEALERQRFLKYDLIWQRAENAFIQKKKSSLE